MEMPIIALACAVTLLVVFTFIWKYYHTTPANVPVSVNYHFTRRCNYQCGFCFHTAKTSYILPLEDAKKGLSLLKQAGMRKLNFAGGEPFLYPKFIGELAKYCKVDLDIESISIVTNGSLVKPNFFDLYGQYIDIIAISCDSFNEATNVKIGRGTGKHLYHLQTLSELCRAHGVKFKINTVVNRYNIDEDMNESICKLAPFRWKCFQVLIVPGENDSDATLRNAKRFVITDEEFRKFCEVHSHNECFVAEPNNLMRDSYLILDEYMRFLSKGNDSSPSILEVGVNAALGWVFWDQKGFVERGGLYDWTREKVAEEKSSLEW
jgi:radical S-adenosyl methionine domain-containing protein 2